MDFQKIRNFLWGDDKVLNSEQELNIGNHQKKAWILIIRIGSVVTCVIVMCFALLFCWDLILNNHSLRENVYAFVKLNFALIFTHGFAVLVGYQIKKPIS